MNMYKYVRVNLVLRKGNWQFWKLKGSPHQGSVAGEAVLENVCGAPAVSDGAGAVAATRWLGRGSGCIRHRAPTLADVVL